MGTRQGGREEREEFDTALATAKLLGVSAEDLWVYEDRRLGARDVEEANPRGKSTAANCHEWPLFWLQ